MENNFEEGKMPREHDYKILEQFEEGFLQRNRGDLPYYELTEAVHEFHMRKL